MSVAIYKDPRREASAQLMGLQPSQVTQARTQRSHSNRTLSMPPVLIVCRTLFASFRNPSRAVLCSNGTMRLYKRSRVGLLASPPPTCLATQSPLCITATDQINTQTHLRRRGMLHVADLWSRWALQVVARALEIGEAQREVAARAHKAAHKARMKQLAESAKSKMAKVCPCRPAQLALR